LGGLTLTFDALDGSPSTRCYRLVLCPSSCWYWPIWPRGRNPSHIEEIPFWSITAALSNDIAITINRIFPQIQEKCPWIPNDLRAADAPAGSFGIAAVAAQAVGLPHSIRRGRTADSPGRDRVGGSPRR
jgi:hypothetical protein